MVLAISFLEAPLKFRAPGVTVPLGLGIGRLVFRALNVTEVVWAALLVAGLLIDGRPTRVVVAGATAVAALVVQLVGVRPLLTRRSDRVLAGEDAPPFSRAPRLYRPGNRQGHCVAGDRDRVARRLKAATCGGSLPIAPRLCSTGAGRVPHVLSPRVRDCRHPCSLWFSFNVIRTAARA